MLVAIVTLTSITMLLLICCAITAMARKQPLGALLHLERASGKSMRSEVTLGQ